MNTQQAINDSSAVARQCARKLFELRGQTGQTQKALAARLGMTESMISRLERGVYLNCGSAVVLPEVFLKAVALVRNRGTKLQGLTTVNVDFVRGYRPETNVVRRPVAGGTGHGYSLIGHHELLIPLLAAALVDGDRS